MTASFFFPFATELVPAKFISRPNRFLVLAETPEGAVEAHLHDPGRLRELLAPGVELLLAPAQNPGRKTPFTVVLARSGDVWVTLHTALPNDVLHGALKERALPEFRDYEVVRREVPFGRGRFDFHLMTAGIDIYMEVKAVSLVRGGVALFPDAPTARGTRHLRELATAAKKGICGTVLFLVQRRDAGEVRPNDETDSAFGDALRDAFRGGLEILAYTTDPSPEGIRLGPRVPVYPFPGGRPV